VCKTPKNPGRFVPICLGSAARALSPSLEASNRAVYATRGWLRINARSFAGTVNVIRK